MFLSRIELDMKRDKTLRAMATPTMIHAAIEGCFPRREGGNERKLWRLDTLGGKLYLLLLSSERPDFASFAAQFSPIGISGESKDYAPLLASIGNGQIWRFRLRANAARSIIEEKGARGKPHAHTTTAHQLEWLQNKAPRCGFSLQEDGFDVVASDTMQFRRSEARDTRVTIGAVVFEGQLTVIDAELFREALTKGVGRAKAYGCGLLTLARPT